MEQPKDIGNKTDLYKYRLETAKKSFGISKNINECKFL